MQSAEACGSNMASTKKTTRKQDLSKAAKHRGQRFESEGELKSAVRDACCAHVKDRGGSDWDEQDDAYVREFSRRLREGEELLKTAAGTLNRVERARQKGTDATERERLKSDMEWALLVAGYKPLNFRAALVVNFDRPGRGWWKKERPLLRDLAVLSLLAGSWPDTDFDPAQVTASELIRMEERAIQRYRQRARAAAPKRTQGIDGA